MTHHLTGAQELTVQLAIILLFCAMVWVIYRTRK